VYLEEQENRPSLARCLSNGAFQKIVTRKPGQDKTLQQLTLMKQKQFSLFIALLKACLVPLLSRSLSLVASLLRRLASLASLLAVHIFGLMFEAFSKGNLQLVFLQDFLLVFLFPFDDVLIHLRMEDFVHKFIMKLLNSLRGFKSTLNESIPSESTLLWKSFFKYQSVCMIVHAFFIKHFPSRPNTSLLNR
jgi:hypothetical protein